MLWMILLLVLCLPSLSGALPPLIWENLSKCDQAVVYFTNPHFPYWREHWEHFQRVCPTGIQPDVACGMMCHAPDIPDMLIFRCVEFCPHESAHLRTRLKQMLPAAPQAPPPPGK